MWLHPAYLAARLQEDPELVLGVAQGRILKDPLGWYARNIARLMKSCSGHTMGYSTKECKWKHGQKFDVHECVNGSNMRDKVVIARSLDSTGKANLSVIYDTFKTVETRFFSQPPGASANGLMSLDGLIFTVSLAAYGARSLPLLAFSIHNLCISISIMIL